jgi:regulator of sigma D
MLKIFHNKTFSKETEVHLMQVTKIHLQLDSQRNQILDLQDQAQTTVSHQDHLKVDSLSQTLRKVVTALLVKQTSTNLIMNSSAVNQI